MLNQIAEFVKAADQAACKMFRDYDEYLTGAALISLGSKAGAPLAAGITLAQMAARYGCTWDNPPPPGGCDGICGCKKMSPQGELGYRNKNNPTQISFQNLQVTEIFYNSCRIENGQMVCTTGVGLPGQTGVYEHKGYMASHWDPCALIAGNGECLEECNGDDPPPMPPVDPIPYTTEDGCTFNLNFEGIGQLPDGQGDFIWRIEPAETTRAAGGRITKCNFQPTIYYGGGGSGDGGGPGTPYTVPYMPGPGDGGIPKWQELLEKAIPTALGNLAAAGIKQLFAAKLPPAEFEFVAPCNVDEEGKQEFKIYQMPEQNYQSRVVTQQAVLMEMLQQHLNWKTPVCFPKDEKGTYARSITFQSDENTERGNRRCTRRFGYRSNSPCEVESLYEHWRDFSWTTGPVVVKHRGSALGSPQVWASSEYEGKRVILHAAREAGVDPDQVGKWSVGGCDHPRYGLPYTVKLMEVRGLWQATAREGPDGHAQAVWTMPDL